MAFRRRDFLGEPDHIVSLPGNKSLSLGHEQSGCQRGIKGLAAPLLKVCPPFPKCAPFRGTEPPGREGERVQGLIRPLTILSSPQALRHCWSRSGDIEGDQPRVIWVTFDPFTRVSTLFAAARGAAQCGGRRAKPNTTELIYETKTDSHHFLDVPDRLHGPLPGGKV